MAVETDEKDVKGPIGHPRTDIRGEEPDLRNDSAIVDSREMQSALMGR